MESKLTAYTKAADFLEHARSYLFEREELNSTLITIAEMAAMGGGPFSSPFGFATINDRAGDIVGCLAHAKPDGLVLSSPIDSMECDLIFGWATERFGIPQRIFGCPTCAKRLVERWMNETGAKVCLQQHWHVFYLDGLTRPHARSPGVLRLGTENERALLRLWGRRYSEEKPAFIDVAEYFSRKLAEKDLFVWDDGGPRALLTVSEKTGSGIKVSSVFTPQEYRGNGYAGSAVAELCSRVLDERYRFVTLDCEADDPAADLYKKLGFEVIDERSSFTLNNTP